MNPQRSAHCSIVEGQFPTELVISTWLMLTIHMWELHDIDGDTSKQIDRRFLSAFRPSYCDPAFDYFYIHRHIFYRIGLAGFRVMDRHRLIVPIAMLLGLTSCYLGYRIVASDTPSYDRRTYHVYYHGQHYLSY